MRFPTRHAALAFLATQLLAAAAAVAQPLAAPPSNPSTPSPPHERLRLFEGQWTTDDSGSAKEYRETCAWMPHGRRHMLCRSQWSSPTGPRESMSVISYDATTGEYLYHGFRSGGPVFRQSGRAYGEGFRFLSEQLTGAGRLRSRVTIEPSGDAAFTMVDEISTGDGPWTVRGTSTLRRVRR